MARSSDRATVVKPFRIGIVGCGRIAYKHAHAVVDSEHTELAVLVDRVPARAVKLAKRFQSQPQVRSELADILDSVDGVILSTPNHLHRDLAVECLRAGVPVLIEKPLAATVSDGEEICRVSEEENTVVAVGYMTRFQENVQLMRTLLQAEYFGSVRRFAYQFGGRGGWSPLSAYNLDRTATGGGVLVSTGSHFLDRLIYWLGYPDESTLIDDSTGGPEANAHATFQYKEQREFSGMAIFSRTVSLRRRFVLETAEGIVSLGESPQAPIQFHPTASPSLTLTIERRSREQRRTANPFQLQAEDFVRACRSSQSPRVSAREGLQSVRLIEELYANRSPLPDDWYSSPGEMETVH